MNYYNDILIRLRLKDKLGRRADEIDAEAEGFTDANYVQSLNALLKDFGNSVVDTAGNLKSLTKGLAEFNDDVYKIQFGLGKVVAIQEAYNTSIESLVENLTWLEEANKDINKSFGVSSVTAEKYAEKIRDIGKTIGYSDITLFKFNDSLNELTNGMLMSSKMTDANKEALYSYQALAQEQLGITKEAASGFEAYAQTMGSSGIRAAEHIKALTDQLEKAGDQGGFDVGLDSLTMQKTIMEEIGALSSDVRLNYSRMGGGLEIAVLKAKALGFTMEQLDKTGENLLNIEQSVGSELEYQLLSGRRLTVEGGKSFTNEYRKAKLMGDATKQTELMADILQKEGKTLKNNFLARQKFAEMTGIGAEELSKALEKQAIAQELGVDNLMKLSGSALNEEIARLKTEYAKDKKDGKKKAEKLDEFLKASDTRTTHEKVVEDNLTTISNGIQSLTKEGGYVAKTQDVRGKVKKVYDAEKTAFMTSRDKLKQFSDVFMKGEIEDPAVAGRKTMTQGLSSAGTVVNSVLKKAVDASGTKEGKSKMSSGRKVKAKDTVIYPESGPAVQLDPKDTIYAMRPGDKYDKQLKQSHNQAFSAGQTIARQSLAGNQISGGPIANSMSMLAAALQKISSTNTSAPTLDVKALASAIATAMQSVKVEAKIRTDDMYSSNRLNNKKNVI